MYFKTLILALVVANTTLAHTVLTNILVNDVNQGDAVCVRMPLAGPDTTSPVIDIDSQKMACGKSPIKLQTSISADEVYLGLSDDPVARVCKVPQAGKVTFVFKMWPDGRQVGSIDPSHRGPCSVYMKHLNGVTSAPGTGDGVSLFPSLLTSTTKLTQ
jgi:hypothetical protein